MDVNLGGTAQVPLTDSNAAGDVYAAGDISVYVRLPDATTAGPFTPTGTDLTNGWYPYTTVQSGLHRFRVVETTGQDTVNEGSFYVWPSYTGHAAAWTPTLADVAALVPTRTIDSDGEQQDTFTALTTPADDQVTGYITRIVGEISATVGEVPSDVFDAAKHTATLGAAWLVERSFPPTSDVQNVANDFVTDYRASLAGLRLASRRVRNTTGRLWTQQLGSSDLGTIYVPTNTADADPLPYFQDGYLQTGGSL